MDLGMTVPIQDAIVVLTATDSEGEAVRIGKMLVQERLAACVNIVPNVRSLYAWRDKFCDQREWILLVKTRRSLFDRLKTRILELHTYEVPEVVSLSVLDGHDAYLQWIFDSTASVPTEEKE